MIILPKWSAKEECVLNRMVSKHVKTWVSPIHFGHQPQGVPSNVLHHSCLPFPACRSPHRLPPSAASSGRVVRGAFRNSDWPGRNWMSPACQLLRLSGGGLQSTMDSQTRRPTLPRSVNDARLVPQTPPFETPDPCRGFGSDPSI